MGIAIDGGLLPETFALERVEAAAGNRYDFEVRPQADATEVVLEAMILVADAQGNVSEEPFELAVAKVEGELEAPAEEPVYPAVTLPAVDVTPAESLEWDLSGGVVLGQVEFTINGQAAHVGDADHVMLDTFTKGVPVAITLSSNVSPAHPFHVHGQLFQILARDGKPVSEPTRCTSAATRP